MSSQFTEQRRQEILYQGQGRTLLDMQRQPELREKLEADARTGDSLVTPEVLEELEEIEELRKMSPKGAFFSTDKVLFVPGFFASCLSDQAKRGLGLIWVSPLLYRTERFGALRLGEYDGRELDYNLKNRVEAVDMLPVVYDVLRLRLEFARYSTSGFPVDWRKSLDGAAWSLVNDLADNDVAINIVAHSQGALVARRAIQLLGPHKAKEKVKKLILLGPANRGSFSAVQSIAGQHQSFALLRKLIIEPPDLFTNVFASMTGLYQLFPHGLPWLDEQDFNLTRKEFWQDNVDFVRLHRFYGWSANIDTEFFNDRTSIILGDNYGQPTVGGVKYIRNVMTPTHMVVGDGTIPHACAVLSGVKTYQSIGTEHSMMGSSRQIWSAVLDILAGEAPSLKRVSDNPSDYFGEMR